MSRCVVCDDQGCEHCPRVDLEPWPAETWDGLETLEIEQLVCDSVDELRRRGETVNALERMWAL